MHDALFAPLALFIVCAGFGAVPGQAPAAGPVVAMPAAFSIDTTTALGAAAERASQLWHKTDGYSLTPPAPIAAPFGPTTIDFAAATLFRTCLGTGIPTGTLPDVDAISLGLDTIPTLGTSPVVFIAPGHWNTLHFSVRRGALGVPGSAIESERLTTGGNEADLFSYVFLGSSCIPPRLQGRTFKSADAVDFGMPLPAEIDGLDLFVNLYWHGTTAANLPLFPTLYFSLEGSAANLARAPWWGGSTPSGATIFASTWNGTAWSCPVVRITPAQLGLLDCEDVDGLAIEDRKVLFSTKTGGCATRDELLYTYLSFTPSPAVAAAAPLQYSTGAKVSSTIGIRSGDDVDALCGDDPLCHNSSHLSSTTPTIERTRGYPGRCDVFPFTVPRQLRVQAYLMPQQAQQYALHIVNGPTGGTGGLYLTLSPRGGTPPWWPSFQVLASFGFPSASAFPGNPRSLTVPLAPWRSAEVLVQAFALDASNNVTLMSDPLMIRL